MHRDTEASGMALVASGNGLELLHAKARTNEPSNQPTNKKKKQHTNKQTNQPTNQQTNKPTNQPAN